MFKSSLSILCLLCFGTGALAELPPLIPRALLVGDPVRAAPLISPDGKRLAYLARDRRGILTLWVQTIEKDDDRPITSALDRPLRLPSPMTPRTYSWQSDNCHLIFFLDHDGDEIDHLYQVIVDSGELRDLTPFKGVSAQPIPGGQKYPDTMLISLNLRDRKVRDAYRLELDTGKLTEVARNPGDVAEWFGNNRGEVVAAQAPHMSDGATDLRVRDSEADPWKTLASYGKEEVIGTAFSPLVVCGFSADDRRIRLAHSEGTLTSRLIEVVIGTGKSKVVDEDSEADLGGMLVSPLTGELDAIWRWKERRVWTLLNPEFKGDFDRLRSLHPGEMALESQDRADKRWIVSFTSDTESTVYYYYNRESHEPIRLFSVQPELERYAKSTVRPIKFQSRDGLTLNGYLTLPEGCPPKRLPVVVLVHGGPHLRDLGLMNGWVQLLANRGYAVLQVNFRGSSGYGKRHLHAGDHAWGRQMLDDLVDAKGWAVKEGFADNERAAIVGNSYGGYAALAALAFRPKEFCCAIAANAPCELPSLLRNIGPDWLTARWMFAQRIGDPDRDRDTLLERSPLEHLDEVSAPLLLAHSGHDVRVPPADADRLAQRLKQRGCDVEYVTFPNEGHNWMRAETRLRWAQAVEKFLAKHLGGRVEETVEDLLPRFDADGPARLR